MEQTAPDYLWLVTRGFGDKDVDGLNEHSCDKERLKKIAPKTRQ